MQALHRVAQPSDPRPEQSSFDARLPRAPGELSPQIDPPACISVKPCAISKSPGKMAQNRRKSGSIFDRNLFLFFPDEGSNRRWLLKGGSAGRIDAHHIFKGDNL